VYPWDDPNHNVMQDLINYKRLWRSEYRMTPIMCFRVKGLELWTQGYSGARLLVATCPDEQQHEWLVNCMVVFHSCKALQWDDPDRMA